ncbi:lipase family protein [Paraburkholderia tropica]|uniref:lipase family protein n=1 Tax=Paraburkholderia tropica TaxID=92647 RepID=UPI003D2C7FD7
MNAHDYALLAQEAYSAKPDIGSAPGPSCAIVRDTANGRVVAFPGTDSIADLMADLDVEPIEVPGAGKIHGGFLKAWRAIAIDVLAAVDGKPVTLVGHSLGAAISLCAAVEMTISGNPPAAVFGFEPPRISPDLGVRTLLSKVPVHLYWNGLDIVPSLPLDWHHAALPVHIGKPALPIPNVVDHQISRVISALA